MAPPVASRGVRSYTARTPPTRRSPPSGGYRAGGAGHGGPLLGQVRHEQGLVDPALEDGHSHLHALLDDLATLEARLPRELRGREMVCHRTTTSCEVCHVQRKVASPADVLNAISSIWPKTQLHTGFGMSTNEWATPKRSARSSPRRRIPCVSVA